jgi:O-antigen ligase
MDIMKNISKTPRRWDSIREQFSFPLAFVIFALLVALLLGTAIGVFNIVYGLAVVGVLIIAIILLLRWDELMVVLIIAVHIVVDWYLALRLVSLPMGLVLLFACYFGRSTNHPWVKPKSLWLWGLFLTLTIYPAIKGGSFSFYDAYTFYPGLIFGAFMMFWLGNIVAKDIATLRRVFQFLSALAVLIAIHTIIQAMTGKFLLETARTEASLAQNLNFQLAQDLGAKISRAGSFFEHPDSNGAFFAFSFFLPLGLFTESKMLWTRLIYLMEMLLILTALMFTYSNAAWIAVFAGILAFMFLAGRKRYSLLILLLLAAATVIVFTFFPSQLALQLSHATYQHGFSLHIGVAQTAVRVIEAFPLFGVGLSSQAYLIYEEPFRVPAQTVPQVDPNNAYLQWGAMAGIPVMLVFLLLLIYVYWFAWRNWKIADIGYRPLLGGGMTALIVLSINSLFLTGWTDSDGIATLGWLVAGLVSSPLIGRYLRQQSAPSVDKAEETILAQS